MIFHQANQLHKFLQHCFLKIHTLFPHENEQQFADCQRVKTLRQLFRLEILEWLQEFLAQDPQRCHRQHKRYCHAQTHHLILGN